MIAVGVLGLVDLAGASIYASAYVAAPLTVIGLGLVVTAWVGRARWLIAIGAVLCFTLGVASVSQVFGRDTTPTTWTPATIEQLEGTYTSVSAAPCLICPHSTSPDRAGPSRSAWTSVT